MPPTRSRLSTNQPLPSDRAGFAFPTDAHLLITTPSRILSWDAFGLHVLFTSSRSGIAAATESKDGSGILAVADRHTVVLHDTKRGQERSWGLSAEGDEVRHLEYTADSKNLFLSTKVTNAVQCYSTQRQRLLSPPQMLASPPVALAVSPSGNLMISAEGQPPTVYLKNLVQNVPPTLLQPQASGAAISVAAFHPERHNIFLVGFESGTMAVYDASRLSRAGGDGSYVDQERIGKGEVGRIAELHRPTASKAGGSQHAITGAAFVPGYKFRILSVGTDGRCKLTDFTDGGLLLRAWHAKAPLTAVSVLGLLGQAFARRSSRARDSASVSKLDGKPPGYIVATGSEDGKVLLYDALGLLQARIKANDTGERLVSVEWVHGPSPRPITSSSITAPPAIDSINEATPRRSSHHRPRRSITPKYLGVHPALRPPNMQASMQSPRTSKQFTVHPDEALEEGTVRHTPSPDRKKLISAQAGAYLDLFSPVNPFIAQQQQQAQKSEALKQNPSPTRARPRISSKTFIKKDSTPHRAVYDKSSDRRAKTLTRSGLHATGSESKTPRNSVKKNVQFKSSRTDSKTRPSNGDPRRTSERRARGLQVVEGSGEAGEALDATVVANARLLRELRQMNSKSADRHAGSILQGYNSRIAKDARVGASVPAEVPKALPPQTSLERGLKTQSKPQEPVSTHSTQKGQRQVVESHVYGRGGRWPTDSVDESSWSDGLEEDIWITSDEESRRSKSHRSHLFRRPPARQTSRSRMNSKGTTSTKHSPANATASRGKATNDGANRGSIDDFATAHSQVSPDAAFSPASEDVRALFPRSSSITPRKKRRMPDKQPVKGREIRSERRGALSEMSPERVNSASARQPNSPWDRARKARSMPLDSTGSNKPFEMNTMHGAIQGFTRDQTDSCGGCAKNASRVQMLEGEVTLMKAEILALKAALRKNDIPVPYVPGR